MVALSYLRLYPNDRLGQRLASTYLSFLAYAQMNDGRFHNFMDYDRRWSDEVGTPDSCGRAIWALGYGVANGSPPWRRVCTERLNCALPIIESLGHLRSRAYAALGLAHAHTAVNDSKYADALRLLAGELRSAYEATASADWQWFEGAMFYDNARLCEAMIRAGRALAEPQFYEVGLRTLAFYEEVTTESGVHVPIGNHGWYYRGRHRARYAQQPLEACAMVEAELAAFDLTGDVDHFASAELAVEWYYGKNSRGATMAHGGGCCDGLEEDAVNTNMGAESTLALLAAAYALALRRERVLHAVR
jgi:hypothetical protein